MMAASTTANPKASHYATALDAALLRGGWADTAPGAAVNGSALSWGELVRKWGKHTGGNTSLVHHLRDISLLYLSSTAQGLTTSTSGYINLSSSIHSVGEPASSAEAAMSASGTSGASGASNTSPAGSGASGGSSTSGTGSFIHIPHPHLPHRGGRRSLDAPSTSGTVRPGSAAAYLSGADLDGDGNARIISGEQADEVREGLRAVQAVMGASLKPGEVDSAKLLLAFHHHALGEYAAALDNYATVDWQNAKAGVVEGDAAVLDRVRGRTLQGLSYELSQEPSKALAAYLSTIPLLAHLTLSPLTAPPYLAKASSAPAFDTQRELHRYLYTALSHAAMLSAASPDALTTLRILRTFHALPSAPSSFRPSQRTSMVLLYLRALLVRPPPGPAVEPYLLAGTTFASSRSGRATWRLEVVEAFRTGQRLFGETTQFPRAGQVNAGVVSFVELVVAFHPLCPPLAPDIIAVLFWAMNLTFHSHAVLRHLARLLGATRQLPEARRTFELYVELVLKARQTHQPDVSLQLKRRPTDDVAAGPGEIREQASAAEAGSERASTDLQEERKTQTSETEMDPDDAFVDALLDGARLLLVELEEPEEAWRYATLAGEVVKSRSGAIVARVEECKGIVRMAMASGGAEASVRPTYQAQAIDHLVASTKLDTRAASAYYHLAYGHAEARAIGPAIDAIRTALELDSENVQAWHLLALLLTARGDWSGAAKACDAGIAVWEAADERDGADGDDEDAPAATADPNVDIKDFAVIPPTPVLSSTHDAGAEPLLLSNGAIRPVPPRRAPRNRAARLNDVIHLRATANVITEKTLGPEAAMLAQQELFAFFSARAIGTRAPAREGSVRGLEGFVNVGRESVTGATPGTTPPMVASEQVPSEHAAPGGELAPPVMTTTAASSPGSSSAGSLGERETESVAGDHEKSRLRDRLARGGTKKLLPKHLHVPSVGGSSSARGSSSNLAMHRTRTASSSSSALSLAPTAVHSTYAATRSPLPPPPPPPAASAAPTSTRTALESRILSDLWLASAATFRRWGKPEQALVAIEEAETLDPENPAVWVQLGLYNVALNNAAAALPAFTKSLLLRPDHPPAVLGLARLYMSSDAAAAPVSGVAPPPVPPSAEPAGVVQAGAGHEPDSKAPSASNAADLDGGRSDAHAATRPIPPQSGGAGGGTELAHSLLNQLTQDKGWDVPEAWFALAQVCERQGRHARARECLEYALKLERSRCVGWRGLRGVERWL